MCIEWLGREGNYALSNITKKWNSPSRWAFYMTLAVLILLFSGAEEEFIYFQF
jgi:hypothetical protein